MCDFDSKDFSDSAITARLREAITGSVGTLMLDASMSSKYALPEDYVDKHSKAAKKRKGDDTASPGTPASAAPKAAATSTVGDEKAGKKGGKGSRSERSYKGQGKGDGNKGGKNHKGQHKGGLDQTVSIHTKMLLRLDMEKRDRDRQIQWAIDFTLPNVLTKQLVNAVEVYRTTKPESGGPHPDGSLNDIQWQIFAGSLYSDMQKLEQNAENHEQLAAVLKCLRDSVYSGAVDKGEKGPDGSKTACTMFRPAHKCNEDTEIWTWLFRIRQDTARGREVHEELLVCSRHVDNLHTHINIRKDRAPKDGLVKALEGQLANLRV